MKVDPPETPTKAWRYEDPEYLDAEKLDREIRRVAEVCHQCRRCLPLCPSFPRLFDLVDATDREVAGVSAAGFDEVNELCFHCKQCFNHCPYTAPHEWDVDFPALMRRQQVFRSRRDGVSLARKLTTRTDLIGRSASFAPALMNFANRNRAARILMERTLGIHRDWVQPSYVFRTVARWFRRRGPRGDGRHGRVVFFTTCSTNYSDPVTAKAAVAVLEHSGVHVEVQYERCCGMPMTDVGDLNGARKNAARNVELLLEAVDAGAHVVVPGPSCSLMLKQEYPRLLETDAARRVAGATRDLMEHLYHLAADKRLERDFAHPLGRVAYHAPCHLRAQNIGMRSQQILGLTGAEVVLVDECSGVDGTWGMQARFHEASLGVARKLMQGLTDAEADHIATDCPLSALRIEECLGRKAVHPVVLLCQAYGLPLE